MRRWILLLALLTEVLFTSEAASYNDYDGRLLSFEESTSPFEAVSGSLLSLSDQHYKHGAKSLCWQWNEAGARVAIRQEIGYLKENPNPKETSVSTFVFWAYAPKKVEGTLRFEFRKEGRTCSWFDYHLGFEGWRGSWIAFDRDMEGEPEEGMDEVVVTILDAPKGELLFDHWILSSFQDVRHHTADLHAPFVNKETTSHWLVLLHSWQQELDNFTPDQAKGPVAYDNAWDADLILSRLERLFMQGTTPRKMENLRKRFAHYAITENPDGTVCGRPIWFVRYAETYINLGYPNEKTVMEQEKTTLRQYNTLLFDVAATYRLSQSEAERQELSEIYVLLTRHLLDQGFEAGSGLGTLHHLGYSMRDFYTAPVLMRDVLREAGLLERVQQAMEWFSGVGEVKLPPREKGMDIDAFNTSMIGRLASLLLIQDLPRKVAYLKAFARWVDNGFQLTEGTGPCFKSDGTVCHHRKHYPAYALDGFRGGAVNIVWLLHDTNYAVSASSHEVLRRALLEMRFYCHERHFPLALSGRHPDGKGALTPWLYGRMATLENRKGEIIPDNEMAAAYMRLTGEEDPLYCRFAEQGITPEESPEGTHIYAYNCSMAHRRDNWLLTVAGHSRYIWASEIYQKANHYGRYLAHGSVQLQDRTTPLESGFRQEGWDWCHIPGTTALEIPMEQMKANVLNVDKYSGYEEMLLSDESFAGGVSHQGLHGLYAMKLHEHDKYNGSLRAHKSVFAFDNRILMLGSEIENSAEGGLHTTLFQCYVADPSTVRVMVNGRAVTFPHEADYEGPVHLVDPNGNTYFVPSGKVHLRMMRQHSLHEESDAPTEGDFCTAWIDHGGIAEGAGYEYQLTVGEGVRTRVRALTCDDRHHAAYDPATGITAVAAFEAGNCPGISPVREVSHPCLYMLHQEGREMTLSVADPDLHLYEGESDEWYDAAGRRIERSVYSREWINNPSAESSVELRLEGRWLLAEENPSVELRHEKRQTILRIRCHEAATQTCKLKRK